MNRGWTTDQHLELRASTMLLIFSGALVLLLRSTFLYDVFFSLVPRADDFMWRFGVNLKRYLAIGALFALVFLGRSLCRKNPQIQFVGEVVFALLLYLLL